MYSQQLLDHFQNPRNVGEVASANAVAEIENPACGDVLHLTAIIANGIILEIRFRAKGCVPAMACASAATELAAKRSLDQVCQITREDIMAAVGGVPPASGHAAQLAMDALTKLLDSVRSVR